MLTSFQGLKRVLVVDPDPLLAASVASLRVDFRIAHRAIHLLNRVDTIEGH
jgi:hypothetical protein